MINLRRWLLDEARARAKMRALFGRLHRDQGGNIIVLYIAASLLLVGMLWAIIGAGARVVQKETIQSSADAAAFSAAVIKAKGLNIIAFCNLLMALLLAIIMVLRLIKGALLIVLGICYASCFNIFGGEVLCAFAPAVQSIYNTYSNILDQVEPRIMDAMKGLAKVERAVNKTFPALSLVEAYRVGTNDQYQKNFGKGSLVTVTWPLPVGDDLSLPTKDGTWDELCDQATESIGRIIEIAISKIGLGPVAGIFGSAVKGLISPIKGLLCGDGGGGGSSTVMIDTTEKKYSCSDCSGAEKSTWIGTEIITNADGTKSYRSGQRCTINGFSGFMCSFKPEVNCGDGKRVKIESLVECLKKVKKPYDMGSDLSDKPKPLVFKDDWRKHKDVRAFTLLTDTSMSERRQSVAVATKDKGSAPMFNQMIGTAQAEFFAFNGSGHDDLWHMNWRARLVRFTFGSTEGSDTGDAAGEGVSGAAAQQVSDQIKNFLMNDGAAALADQFMLH